MVAITDAQLKEFVKTLERLGVTPEQFNVPCRNGLFNWMFHPLADLRDTHTIQECVGLRHWGRMLDCTDRPATEPEPNDRPILHHLEVGPFMWGDMRAVVITRGDIKYLMKGGDLSAKLNGHVGNATLRQMMKAVQALIPRAWRPKRRFPENSGDVDKSIFFPGTIFGSKWRDRHETKEVKGLHWDEDCWRDCWLFVDKDDKYPDDQPIRIVLHPFGGENEFFRQHRFPK